MFSVGTSEIMVIMIVALLIYGKRLPEVARQLGRTFAEFKRGIAGLQREFQDELMRDERPAPRPTPSTAPLLTPAAPPPEIRTAPLPVPGAEAVPPADKELTPPVDSPLVPHVGP